MLFKPLNQLFLGIMSWENYGFIIASSYRRRILESLQKSPKTPSEISEATGIHKGNVSKVLGELRKKEFVECLTPLSRKGRIYKLTRKGKDVIKKFKKFS